MTFDMKPHCWKIGAQSEGGNGGRITTILQHILGWLKTLLGQLDKFPDFRRFDVFFGSNRAF